MTVRETGGEQMIDEKPTKEEIVEAIQEGVREAFELHFLDDWAARADQISQGVEAAFAPYWGEGRPGDVARWRADVLQTIEDAVYRAFRDAISEGDLKVDIVGGK